MKQRIDPDSIEMALDIMAATADRLGVTGVAVIGARSVHEDINHCNIAFHTRVCGRIGRKPDPEVGGPSDMGANYLAIALAKAAQVARIASDSGAAVFRKGEVPYRGGVNRYMMEHFGIAAFSGGDEDQDLIIAQAGVEMLVEIDAE